MPLTRRITSLAVKFNLGKRISLAPSTSPVSQVMRWMSRVESANQIWFPEGSPEGFSVTISLFGGERRRMADLILIQTLTQPCVGQAADGGKAASNTFWHQLINSNPMRRLQLDWTTCLCNVLPHSFLSPRAILATFEAVVDLSHINWQGETCAI